MGNNLFLTGEKQVGKSTIINYFIERNYGKVDGFKTLVENDPNRKFYMQPLLYEKTCNKEAYIGERINNKLISFPETFEKLGVEILTNCLQNQPSIIIMDEIGVMENNASKFQKLVHECLNSSIPVLGVLKNKSTPFLNSIKNRSDVELRTVTVENRDDLLHNLKKIAFL